MSRPTTLILQQIQVDFCLSKTLSLSHIDITSKNRSLNKWNIWPVGSPKHFLRELIVTITRFFASTLLQTKFFWLFMCFGLWLISEFLLKTVGRKQECREGLLDLFILKEEDEKGTNGFLWREFLCGAMSVGRRGEEDDNFELWEEADLQNENLSFLGNFMAPLLGSFFD